MSRTVRTRDELLLDLADALVPGEPARLLVVFRLGGQLVFEPETTEALFSRLAGHVTGAAGAATLYYTPRRDELCALVTAGLLDVERALCLTLGDAHDSLAPGVSLGFGTVVLPHEASDPLAALELADRRIVGVGDGEPVARSRADDVGRRPVPQLA